MNIDILLLGFNCVLLMGILIIMAMKAADEYDGLTHIFSLLNTIRMTQEELATKLQELNAQLQKAKTEITDKIAALETAVINAGTVAPEVAAALDELKSSAQTLDDLNADAVA